MQRKVFDVLASAAGILMVLMLVIAGVLLMWGYSFANSNVHNQLAEQQITFPSKAAFAHPVAGGEITPSMIPSVSQYAGQDLTTAQQAQVYANDFIAVHLNEIGGGLTYSQLSARAMALPKKLERSSAATGPMNCTRSPSRRGTTSRSKYASS